MKKPKDLKPSTLSLHAGQRPDTDFGARATPIYQSSSFVFPDTETAAGVFNAERAGHVYSRITNPTNAVLEERISALEGGVGAIATSSGQAALVLAITTILEKGFPVELRSYQVSQHVLRQRKSRFHLSLQRQALKTI